jgi:hypothetical protein
MSKTPAAIASNICLGATQLEKLRAWMKAEGVILKLDSEVVKKIDPEVGIGTKMDPIFGACEHFLEDNREPQLCKFCDTRLDEDICLKIESHVFKMLSLRPTRGEEVSEIPSMDHCAPGNQEEVAILLGGDHGDRCFRFDAKIDLLSPMEQNKARRKDLLHQCPIVQVACCKCEKDNCAVLKARVMPWSRKSARFLFMIPPTSSMVHGRHVLCQKALQLGQCHSSRGECNATFKGWKMCHCPAPSRFACVQMKVGNLKTTLLFLLLS